LSKPLEITNAMDRSSPERPVRGRCPICRAPTVHAYRPFCSRRCADVDLARWLGGVYAIAGAPDADEDGDAAEARRQGIANSNKPPVEDR
jgi:endogenous inhibitor of DNA gyrase (YacG/DUF329 family)